MTRLPDRIDNALRAANSRPLSRRWQALLLGGFSLLGLAVLPFRFYTTPEGFSLPSLPVILLFVLFAPLMLLPCAMVFRELARRKAAPMPYLLLGSALLCVLALRMAFISHESGDYTRFLHPWVQAMAQLPFGEAVSGRYTNYNTPYEYLIFLISRTPLPPLYLYKWFSMAFDIAAAYLVMQIALRIGQKRLAVALTGFFAVLCWPTFLLNSAMWAQCDAVYAALALAGLYAALRNHPYRCVVFFASALAFKLQAVFLLPILLPLWAAGKVRFKHLLAFIGFYLLWMIPALLAGMAPIRILTNYVEQAGSYQGLAIKAPSLFQLIIVPLEQHGMFAAFGTMLAICAALGLCALLVVRRRRLTPALLIDAALVLCVMIPFLLPHMHERYFYLAELCALAYAVLHPRRFPVAVLLMLSALNGYLDFLSAVTFMPYACATFLTMGALCYTGLQLAHDLHTAPEAALEI